MATATLPGAEELRALQAADETGLFRQTEYDGERELFLNRELSWLGFNRRVLLESADETLPAFERLKFLSIYGTNLDEFYMVRVGALADRSALHPWRGDRLTGMTPREQLTAVAEETAAQIPLLEQQYQAVCAALDAAGIQLLDCEALAPADEALAREQFQALQPLLQPQIVPRGRPLPFLRNREQYVIALLGHGKRGAVGLIPTMHLPRYCAVTLKGVTKIIPTPALVRRWAGALFPQHTVEETALLRVTRSAELDAGDLMDDADADFRAVMERLLRERRRLEPVRAQLSAGASGRMTELVRAELKLPKKRVFCYRMPLDLAFVQRIGEDLVPKALRMQLPESAKVSRLRRGEYFDHLARRDILIALPYQSIDPFVDLLYEAADAADVKSISITLYRLAGSSRIAAALSYAAQRGKRVRCVLELRARFDEQNNIDYSRMLERSGCEIHYGLTDYKVHAKLCVIERCVPGGTIYYTQVGTGNYNESTAEQYTDLMLLTADPAVGRDAMRVFLALDRGEIAETSEALITSPRDFRPWLVARIAEQAALGSAGRVLIKANSMNDPVVMAALARASAAGAEIELFIRGICCLRPGVEGRTDQIQIRSIIGRYLEHERIYVFGRGGDTRVWFGSGDLLERNTVRRLEAFVEVRQNDVREQLLAIFEFMRRDDRKAWVMQPDGEYRRPEPPGHFISQAALQGYFAQRRIERAQPKPQTQTVLRAAPKSAPAPPAQVPIAPPALQAPVQPAKKSWWRRLLDWLLGEA